MAIKGRKSSPTYRKPGADARIIPNGGVPSLHQPKPVGIREMTPNMPTGVGLHTMKIDKSEFKKPF